MKIAEIGGQAALQLRGMMKGEIEDFSHRVQQASAIIRKSSHEVDRYGLIYQKAIDYIHAKPLENVSVTELARSSGVSRRALERAFSRCADSSPAALIRQHRVDAIIGLLKDDTASLESISQQAGFSDAAGLSNFIKRMTGKTPGSYRV